MIDKEKYLQDIQNVPVNENELRKQRIPVAHPVQDAPMTKTLDHGLVNGEIGNYDHDKVDKALLHLQEEPASEEFAFKAIPRLLEMIEPTDRAKVYIAKLADTLEVEGYSTDAKIVRESLKRMNGEKVPMATMDDEPASDDLEEEIEKYWTYSDLRWITYGEIMSKVRTLLSDTARHFAEWQKEKYVNDMLLSDTIARECYEKGRKDMKEQIMKGKVNMYSDLMGGICIKNKWLIEAMKAANIEKGSMVYIVVVPKED